MKKNLVFITTIVLVSFVGSVAGAEFGMLKKSNHQIIQLAAWEGFDYDRGSYIEIDKGNLVRTGREIEIYDYGTGEYKDVEVQSIDRMGNSVEIEVYDTDTGEYRTFEME